MISGLFFGLGIGMAAYASAKFWFWRAGSPQAVEIESTQGILPADSGHSGNSLA